MRLFAPLLPEVALRVGQGLRLDQQTLSFVAATAPAKPYHDSRSRALRLGPARQQRISRRQEFEIVEADAAQARRAGIFHHQEIAGAAAPVAGPFAVHRSIRGSTAGSPPAPAHG